VLVVEQPRDVASLESTGRYAGVYHVLMGRLAPLEGVGPAELNIDVLLERAEEGVPGPDLESRIPLEEVVLGLNPTLEGDGTALYLARELQKRGVRVSRLARGLPTGSSLEMLSKAVLADAIEGRTALEKDPDAT
ncbi:MAG: toprim domain-containing protein, partial [Phycisphaeraceae bacterium]|nr:toprim domain-containing protein [Phycisphaeraceae bacterium]